MLETSRVYRATTAVTERLSALVRGSYLYRWLTAEPDPDIIVIDLRETWTVGPFITILDRFVAAGASATEGSAALRAFEAGADRTLAAPVRMFGVALLFCALAVAAIGALMGSLRVLLVAVAFGVVGAIGLREGRSWHELKETQAVQLAIAAFEPPEPPDTREGGDKPGQATVDDSERDDLEKSRLQADNQDGTGGRQ